MLVFKLTKLLEYVLIKHQVLPLVAYSINIVLQNQKDWEANDKENTKFI